MLCGAYGLDPRVVETWTMGEFVAWIDGASERKKDGDLRLAMIVRTLRLVNGDKMAPSINAIAGYREPATILAFDPSAAAELTIAARDAASEKQRAREHREWLDGLDEVSRDD